MRDLFVSPVLAISRFSKNLSRRFGKKTASVVYLVVFAVPAMGQSKPIMVDANGGGDYKTLQEAITAVPDNSSSRTVIHLKPGTYQGPVEVPPAKKKLTVQGEDAATTIIAWDRNVNDPKPPGADGFNPGFHVAADDFIAENITFQNTSGDHGQALALRSDADRVIFRKCRATGWQDTVYINKGRHYFEDCHIEGRVDFIYGDATAVFDHCEIQSKNGGYLTAANTPQNQPFGFVFLNCKIIGTPDPWVDPTGKIPAKKAGADALLGRPWRAYASVTFINCEMGAHIRPEGWSDWHKVENQSTARFSEYNTTGPGAKIDKRVPWAKQLTKDQADQITVEKVLGGSDNWNPKQIDAASK